jgi:AraC-like DNA-binding protein
MIRWLTTPKSPKVRKYIETYWYLEKSHDAESFKRPKLNPDPSAHLILCTPDQSYHYKVENEVQTGKASHWLYPYSKTLELDHTQAVYSIGIKFKVGALYSLNHVDCNNQSHNTANPLNFEIFNYPPLINVNKLLQAAKNEPDICSDMLDESLLPLLSDCSEDKHSELTRRVILLLAQTPINELGAMLGCSQRTLERSFLRVTGFTLKQCQSMNKLEAMLEYLYQRQQSEIDWGDIAYQFGFSDQPHLIRYLKQQINVTPKSYAQQRGFTIDVYGGVISK